MIRTMSGTALATLCGALLCVRVDAAALSFTGTLDADDAVQTFTFTLSAPGSVTIKTWSYAGGSNAAGTPVPQGGFDPGIALFNALGTLLVHTANGWQIGAIADNRGTDSLPVAGTAVPQAR